MEIEKLAAHLLRPLGIVLANVARRMRRFRQSEASHHARYEHFLRNSFIADLLGINAALLIYVLNIHIFMEKAFCVC